jgi:16S rRNA (uracil1498-N3)-methyltransferase
VLPRFHIESLPMSPGAQVALPEGAARHVQVLRMQPGDALRLFDGQGQECLATVMEMGRKSVTVTLGEPVHEPRELPVRVTLAMGMPANDRMDALVEKAAELGVHAIQPLVCARSVLRLDGERAAKKVSHWQAVAVSACEQSGRAVVPQVHPVRSVSSWLQSLEARAESAPVMRGVLSLRDAVSVRQWLATAAPQDAAKVPRDWCFLSGPEGGLSAEEEALALSQGWSAVSLGKRVLRADTAPLAMLSVLGAQFEG